MKAIYNNTSSKQNFTITNNKNVIRPNLNIISTQTSDKDISIQQNKLEFSLNGKDVSAPFLDNKLTYLNKKSFSDLLNNSQIVVKDFGNNNYYIDVLPKLRGGSSGNKPKPDPEVLFNQINDIQTQVESTFPTNVKQAIVLIGDTGSGKSTLAHYLCESHLEARILPPVNDVSLFNQSPL
ncbi:MAG TPA: hypothetical protein QKA14_00860 [Candidatus Megaira endosymbiont of Hartmannula sinica]|nr:hypothetical protein [Candidatus Megaera endosymbiont of Hartmannula sinica]